MDFKTVLKLLLDGFKKGDVRYALIGGFALAALGIPRSTVDLDFLVRQEDLPKVDIIMKNNNYKCVFKSENVSQYVSGIKIFGEVDFLHAFRKISLGMLDRAIEKDIFEGKLKIKILRPEDIIGLKIQALANDNNRAKREYVDIEAVLDYYKKTLDWNLIEEYFSIFGQKSDFLKLKRKYYLC
ncbi:MAG: nucleotidyl transferase AbiEii/AbiGii toxin family protein [Candidatus Omnitrophota bacterium]